MIAPALAARDLEPLPADAALICARTLARHSKSFALAGKLLPEQQRRDAAVLYTYCRLVDDSIDLVQDRAQRTALAELQRALDAVYGGSAQTDIRLCAFQELVQRRNLPRAYPEQLLAGMGMDCAGTVYESLDDLLLYCHRVAGVVGLMMCHVLGLSDSRALRNAAHLGIAMQLTNICRDVAEDWRRGRLYLPLRMLRECGWDAVSGCCRGPLPEAARQAVTIVTQRLLNEADRFYRSGDAGLLALPWRAAFSIRAARLIYCAIGGRIRQAHYDAYSMRAVVPTAHKLRLLVQAALLTALQLPGRFRKLHGQVPLESRLRFPDDILPI